MKRTIHNDRLLIPLYHGTSTLFLDSVVKHGLGGINPMKDWNVLELAKEILILSEKHLTMSETFSAHHTPLRKMTEQEAGTINWQHGDTYVFPAKQTAIRYATSKRLAVDRIDWTAERRS